MESGSQSASPLDRPTNLLAELLGTCVALLTLILPLIVIGHYSSNPAPSTDLSSPTYSLQHSNNSNN